MVGPTGSGKSSLVSLIPRIYDPTAGEILLDGIPLPRHGSGRAQGPHRDGSSGLLPLLRHHRGQHRPGLGRRWPAGESTGRFKDERQDASRVAQIHDTILSFPGRLLHPAGRTGHQPLGRTETTNHPGQSPGPGSLRPHPRRCPERGGHSHRGQNPGGPEEGPGRPHLLYHQPPGFRSHERGSDPGFGRGKIVERGTQPTSWLGGAPTPTSYERQLLEEELEEEEVAVS